MSTPRPSLPASRPTPTRTVLIGLLSLLLGGLLGTVALPARAETGGRASSLDLQVDVERDGSVRVSQTLTFTEPPPAEISQRIALRQTVLGDRENVYTVSDVTASEGLTPTVQESGDAVTVTLPTEGTSEPVTLAYTVTGATFAAGESTQMRWRVLQGLSVGVDEVTGRVTIPGLAQDFQCFAGPPDATNPRVCRFSAAGSEDYPQPEFADGARGAGEMVLLQITLPSEAVVVTEQIERRWTLGGAFSAAPLPLAVALAVLVLGGLAIFALHRRAGRDARPGSPVRVAEFRPRGENQHDFALLTPIRPGQVGTLVDERVDPIDITASIIDLAVRGHLRIEELPHPDPFARTDWKLVRLPSGEGAELAGFEAELLEALTPPEGRDALLVSEIGPAVSARIGEVQSRLYDDAVQSGWFAARPDSTRTTWGTAAAVALLGAVVATGVLVALTTFGLLGLSLLALALGLAFVGQEMPARTRAGSSVLAGLGLLGGELQSEPTDRMPPGEELKELSEVLPYAIVLGGRDRWIDAIVRTDDDTEADPTELTWYHGPADWHLQHLPDSLKSFIVTVSGNMFAR